VIIPSIRVYGSCCRAEISSYQSRIDSFNEEESFRACLHFLRSRGYQTAVQATLDQLSQTKPNFNFESEFESRLYHSLLSRDFVKSEEIILSNLDSFGTGRTYKAEWKKVKNQKPTDQSTWPCERSGHQMVAFDNCFYLFGGWTGHSDLNDFWQFDAEQNKWNMLSSNTQQDNGPSPRSCFKMVIDRQLGTTNTLEYTRLNNWLREYLLVGAICRQTTASGAS